jgi:hypothetical protein
VWKDRLRNLTVQRGGLQQLSGGGPKEEVEVAYTGGVGVVARLLMHAEDVYIELPRLEQQRNKCLLSLMLCARPRVLVEQQQHVLAAREL